MADPTQPSPDPERDSLAETEFGTLAEGDGDGERQGGAATSSFEIVEAVPARIGRFTILRRVGAGAMGVVFAAYDERLDRKVALKLLHRRDLPERLIREARGLAQLSHPNVVQIYEIGEHEGSAFLAMEFVDGQTLSAWLAARDEGGWQGRMAVLVEAGRGLAAAHHKGLVHRDFKPDNVMVDREGRVRVMDFGLVRHARELADSPAEEREGAEPVEPDPNTVVERGLTRTGALMGTPAYMAPEQHAGEPADARSDQFAFCVALWEALYGERPYEGSNLAQLYLAVAKGTRREPARAAEVPGWVRATIERGLSPKPEARWPSMTELLAALARDPSHRRRWTLALGLGATLVAGSILGLRTQARVERERVAAACKSAAAPVDESWSPSVAAEVEAALDNSGLEAGPELWTRVEAGLDDYTQRWKRLHEQACLDAAAAETRQAPLERDTRAVHACLREAKIALDASVGQLRRADRVIATRALGLVASLPRLERCTDAMSLALRPPVPAGVEGELERLHRRLAEAELESYTARYASALAAGEELVSDAEALGWSPLVAETMIFVGLQHHRLGEFEAAEAVLRQAFGRAIEAGADELALRAATRLVRVVGYDQSRPAEGLQWADYGAALVARLGLQHQLEEAALLNELGNVRSDQGEVEASAGLYAEALAIAEARLGHDALQAAAYRYNLANIDILEGRLERARRNLERALAMREQILGPEHPAVAQALSGLASLLDDLGEVDEARSLATRALAIRESAFSPGHRSVGLSYSLLGAIESGEGNNELAQAHFEQALAIYREVFGPTHPRVSMVLGNLGVTALGLDDTEGALAYFEQSAAATEPGTRAQVIALRRLAVIQSSFGLQAEGQRGLERALAVAEASFGPNDPLTAWVVRSLGVEALEWGEHDQALAHLQRALGVYRAEHDEREIAETTFYLGRTQLELGRPHEALVMIDQAIEAELVPHAESHYYRAQALLALGENDAADEAARTAIQVAGPGEYADEIQAWAAQL